VEGSVTPPAPPVLRVPAGASTTVPASEADTATLPKSMFTFLTMVIGVMMVAEAEAVAVDCANELLEKAIAIAAVASTLEKLFILVVCFFKFRNVFLSSFDLIGILLIACQTINQLIINTLSL
jgi:hypothetical protein